MPKTLVAQLAPQDDIAMQIRWAIFVAKIYKLDLLLVHRLQNRSNQTVEVALDQPLKPGALFEIQEVHKLVQADPELQAAPSARPAAHEPDAAVAPEEPRIIQVRMKIIHFTSPSALRKLIFTELRQKDVELATQARSQCLDTRDAQLLRERRLLLRYTPCRILVGQNIRKDNPLRHALVAAASGPNGKAALKFGLDLAKAQQCVPTVLHVNPDVGEDSERIGERRIKRFIQKNMDAEPVAIEHCVIVDDDVIHGIQRAWNSRDVDLVVLGAPPSHLEESIGMKLGSEIPVALVIKASPLTHRVRGLLETVFEQHVPQIEREDRVALVDRLQSSAAWNFDFVSLMVLSTVMAAIGLIQNSSAVVIGAMLVAPLMTPLLGLGLALVQGNHILAKVSIRSIVLGLFVSLLGGFLVGVLAFGFNEPTREMMARGAPGFLDLSVAFAAGLAAAYASSRPGLVAALPGVAIAAALVPPISTAGLALALGDFPLAFGALLLFIINMVTIVLASMTSLWMVGLRNLKKTHRWTTASIRAVLVSVLILGIYLSFRPHAGIALTRTVPPGLSKIVKDGLDKGYRLDSLSIAYDELGLQLNITVTGTEPISKKMATKLRTAISSLYNQPVRVRLLTTIDIKDLSQTSEVQFISPGTAQ